jgi:hypothetical protein
MTIELTTQVLVHIVYLVIIPLTSYFVFYKTKEYFKKKTAAELSSLEVGFKQKLDVLENTRHSEVKKLKGDIEALKEENAKDIESRNEAFDKELVEAQDLIQGRVREIEGVYKSALDDQNKTLELYEKYIKNFDAILTLSSEKLKDLDQKGVFKTDDEIGFFFENVLYLQDLLNNFKIEKELLDGNADETED